MRRYTKEELYIEELKSKIYDMVCDTDIVLEVCESVDDDGVGEFKTRKEAELELIRLRKIDSVSYYTM